MPAEARLRDPGAGVGSTVVGLEPHSCLLRRERSSIMLDAVCATIRVSNRHSHSRNSAIQARGSGRLVEPTPVRPSI